MKEFKKMKICDVLKKLKVIVASYNNNHPKLLSKISNRSEWLI